VIPYVLFKTWQTGGAEVRPLSDSADWIRPLPLTSHVVPRSEMMNDDGGVRADVRSAHSSEAQHASVRVHVDTIDDCSASA